MGIARSVIPIFFVWISVVSSFTVNRNLTPLTFHENHDQSIRLNKEKTIAYRTGNHPDHGVVFSSRPIKVNERIYLRVVDAEKLTQTMINFGFIKVDPNSFDGKFPANDDPLVWMRFYGDRFAGGKDKTFFYYATKNGTVHFGVNGEEKGVKEGVDTSGQLWALMNIKANTKAVEFLGSDTVVAEELHKSTYNDVESTTESSQWQTTEFLTTQVDNGSKLKHIAFHHLHSDNIVLSEKSTVATHSTFIGGGTAFSDRPVQVDERIHVRRVKIPTWKIYSYFGFTSFVPTEQQNFPRFDDPRVWSVELNTYVKKGSVLSFYVTNNGVVHYEVDGQKLGNFSGVDTKKTLRAYFYITGNDVIQLLGTDSVPPSSFTIEVPLTEVSQSVYDKSSTVILTSGNYLNSDSSIWQDNTTLSMPFTDKEKHSNSEYLELSTTESQMMLTTTTRTNQLSPLTFNTVNSQNVQLSSNRKIARRISGESDAQVLSSRPINYYERIYFRFPSLSDVNETQGAYFGFTKINPVNFEWITPLNDFEIWGRFIPFRYVNTENVYYYYFTPNGNVQFGINDKEINAFSGVYTRDQLWAFFIIHGRTSSIELLGTDMFSKTTESALTKTADVITLKPNSATAESSNGKPLIQIFIDKLNLDSIVMGGK